MPDTHRGALFVKSSHSDPQYCVEVARPETGPVGVRDSKDPSGPVLAFEPDAWKSFLDFAKICEV
jgi:hypothetical protein